LLLLLRILADYPNPEKYFRKEIRRETRKSSVDDGSESVQGIAWKFNRFFIERRLKVYRTTPESLSNDA